MLQRRWPSRTGWRVVIAVPLLGAVVPMHAARADSPLSGQFVGSSAGLLSCFSERAGLGVDSCVIATRLASGSVDVTVIRGDGSSGRALLAADALTVSDDAMTLAGDLPMFGPSTATIVFSSPPSESQAGAVASPVSWEWVSAAGGITTGHLVLESGARRFAASGSFVFVQPTSGAWVAPSAS